jgi:hypothetical protein
MASPSPSDLCWVIGFTPHGRWIAQILRAAVGLELNAARQMAATHLGDENLAPEVMELAIQLTAEHLADLSPIGVEEARVILRRYYRNEVRRRRRSETKLSFLGTADEVATLRPSPDFSFSAVEAKLDLDKLLRDTPAEVRTAMLLRYGARGRWSEVGQTVSKSREAVRKSCQRGMDLIRKRMGIGDHARQDNHTDDLSRKGPREEASQLRERRRG